MVLSFKKQLWLLTVLFCLRGLGQVNSRPKPPLPESALQFWPHVTDAIVSNDGRYMACNLSYDLSYHTATPGKLLVREIGGTLSLGIPGVMPASRKVFTEDSRRLVFMNEHDSLGVLSLDSGGIVFFPGVAGFSVAGSGSNEWLIYQSGADKRLTVYDLSTKTSNSLAGVDRYVVGNEGSSLATVAGDPAVGQVLKWVGLPGLDSQTVFRGKGIGNVVWNREGTALAFVGTSMVDGKAGQSIGIMRAGEKAATLMACGDLLRADTTLELENLASFSADGRKLYVMLREKKLRERDGLARVTIWSYLAPRLPTEYEEKDRGPYMGVIDLGSMELRRLQYKYERIWRPSVANGDKVVLAVAERGNQADFQWNRTSRPTVALVNVEDGSRKALVPPFAFLRVHISPMGKYVVFGDNGRDFYTYNIATGAYKKITGSLPVPFGGEEFDDPWLMNSRDLFAVDWIKDDAAIITHDSYDYWQLDPDGKKAPICLTGGVGRQKRINFRLVLASGPEMKENGEEMVLSAFRQSDKKGGFAKVVLGQRNTPSLAGLGPYNYDFPYERLPVKAKDANVFVLMRESATESPNVVCTINFSDFSTLTDLHPERDVNWMKAGLISFKTLDGQDRQAIVYKPENFDASKKYPTIIHYYTRRTNELYHFQRPVVDNGGELDIAWFVSHGYVVVLPDIFYRQGEIGQSAYDAVAGVAKHIGGFPWIDAKHIGIQGHSLGGYQTSYLASRGDLFAAAVSSSGMSDLVSGYLGFMGEGASYEWYENRVSRIGTTLWDRPDLYIKNSPIYRLPKITIPLLTVANREDRNVQFHQGIELFNGLRRLGKRAWMLEYDGEGHGVGGIDYADFVKRSMQFFDHYLRDSAAPKWMLEGIQINKKAVEGGFELVREKDANGKWKTPALGGLLTEEEKVKGRKLAERKPRTIVIP